MLRTAECADCHYPRCLCHMPQCGECKKPVDKYGDRSIGCQCHKRVFPDTLVPLYEVEPPVKDGLIIEGVGTTIDWNANDVPFALGLIRAQPGLKPRMMKDCLPIPLLWRHEWDKPLGSMFAASATETALHFRACVVPPGTPGYDGDLLFKVWDDVQSGAAPAVSFASEIAARDGSWRGKELSVVNSPGNPFAVITRVISPYGHVLTREAPKFTREASQLAWLKFMETHKQNAAVVQTRSDKAETSDTRSPALAPMIYLGTWKADAVYSRGNTVTHHGCLWHVETDNVTDKPGTSPAFKLMHKSMEGTRR